MRPIKRLARCVIGLALNAALIAAPVARAAPLVVLSSGAFKPVAVEIADNFGRQRGVQVSVQNDTAGALQKKIEAGANFDLVILTPEQLGQLGAKHLVDPSSIVPVARVGISVAVPRGAPLPAINTVDAFKQTLLKARAVAYIDPKAGGSSGIYIAKLLSRLGLADALAAKTVLVEGGLVGTKLVDGEADVAVHQTSELLLVPGITVVGPLPEAIQSYTTYAAALAPQPTDPAAARALLDELAGPTGTAMIRAKGMLPANR